MKRCPRLGSPMQSGDQHRFTRTRDAMNACDPVAAQRQVHERSFLHGRQSGRFQRAQQAIGRCDWSAIFDRESEMLRQGLLEAD